MSFLARPPYQTQPPAYFHPRILVGPGCFLTRRFVHTKGITHVINCALEEDSPRWWREDHPHQYTVLNAIDSPLCDIMLWYPTFSRKMSRFLKEGTGVIYVHCQAGINRSASLSLAYCCEKFSNSVDQLLTASLRQRPCMFTNKVFTNQVREFINGRLQSEKNT